MTVFTDEEHILDHRQFGDSFIEAITHVAIDRSLRGLFVHHAVKISEVSGQKCGKLRKWVAGEGGGGENDDASLACSMLKAEYCPV